MSICIFDEATHTYTRDGVRLPSITEVITACWPRTDGAPESAIEHARERGVWVDSAFTAYLTDGTVEIPTGTPQEFADCLGMAIDWWDAERGGASVECQVRLFGNKEAGSADLVVDGHSIIDLKATWEISKTVGAQLGGYSTLREEMGQYSDHLAILHVHRRLKVAKFVDIHYEEACRQWRVIRDFWRLTRAA
jgi:hypothetical protein